MTETATALRIDVWADIVCPFCYVGEARLERAAASLGEGADVTIVPRGFELDPSHSHPMPVLDALAAKFGRTREEVASMNVRIADMAEAEGLPYTMDRLSANTFEVHRLIAAAQAEAGLGLAVLSVVQRGYFGGTLNLGDADALAVAAESAGLSRDRALAVLAGDEYADDVRADVALARELGVTGVPFTVVAERYAIAGAQPLEQYEHVLRTALAESALADEAPAPAAR